MIANILNSKYKNCYIRFCLAVLLLISIHSWWNFYQINKRSHFVKSFFGIRSSDCTIHYPQNESLQFKNQYWQVLNTSTCSIYIFGAYLDVRNDKNKQIRFTTIFDKLEPRARLHAQVWYNPNDVKVSVTVKCEFRLMWHLKWGIKTPEFPFLVSCTLREDLNWRMVVAASLVEDTCDMARNRLTVRRNEEVVNKTDFGVCVKGLNIKDTNLTIRLIEWIELVHLLGAHKIFFYELSIHSHLKSILKYYIDKQMVSVVPIRLPSTKYHDKLLSKRHNEMIVYNDCFYQHHDQYKYIVLLDIDEVIVPTTANNWQDLFAILSTRFKLGVFPTINSICVRNIYFLDKFRGTNYWFQGIPKHMHMLQYVYRQKNFSRVGFYTKCFHATQNTVILHNHFAFACDKKCLYHHLDVKLAQLNHYRNNCHENTTIDCDRRKKQLVMDFGIWKYKEKLIANVEKVVQDLDLHYLIK